MSLMTLCVFSLCSFAQKEKTDSLQQIIDDMAASNLYEMTLTIGYTGKSSSQLQRFESLSLLATEHQLLDLAKKHANAVVRLYAYQSLKLRKIPVPPAVEVLMKSDRSIVRTLKGCIAEDQLVSQLANGELPTFPDQWKL